MSVELRKEDGYVERRQSPIRRRRHARKHAAARCLRLQAGSRRPTAAGYSRLLLLLPAPCHPERGCHPTAGVIPSAARDPHRPERGPSIGPLTIPRLPARDDTPFSRSPVARRPSPVARRPSPVPGSSPAACRLSAFQYLANDNQDQNDRDEAEAHRRDTPADPRLRRDRHADAQGRNRDGERRHPPGHAGLLATRREPEQNCADDERRRQRKSHATKLATARAPRRPRWRCGIQLASRQAALVVEDDRQCGGKATTWSVGHEQRPNGPRSE